MKKLVLSVKFREVLWNLSATASVVEDVEASRIPIQCLLAVPMRLYVSTRLPALVHWDCPECGWKDDSV